MVVAMYVVSVLWIAMGAFLVIDTRRARELLDRLYRVKNVRVLGVLPIVFGVIFVVGAFFFSKMFWLAFILGVLALLKGVYLFLGREAQIKSLIEWWCQRASEQTVRLFGLIAYTLGCAVLSYLG